MSKSHRLLKKRGLLWEERSQPLDLFLHGAMFQDTGYLVHGQVCSRTPLGTGKIYDHLFLGSSGLTNSRVDLLTLPRLDLPSPLRMRAGNAEDIVPPRDNLRAFHSLLWEEQRALELC